jgi:hypothetical protein
MPTKNPTADRPIPTENPVFFALNNEPVLPVLAFKSDQKHIIDRLQSQSDRMISSAEDFGLAPEARAARAEQLSGMLELIGLLVDAEMQVPAILEGLVRAEIGRVRQ